MEAGESENKQKRANSASGVGFQERASGSNLSELDQKAD